MSQIRVFFHDHPKIIITGLLLAILALGAFLRFYALGASGVGNIYYAAAVKSMLLSWKNFFFVAFEPGGSVSVDKPPLGLWAQALSAYFLGVTGFALALPNAVAGLLSIFVVYQLVRRPFGAWIGLVAALALAITPVAVSVERNNAVDGLLVFVLLLAAWAFLQSTYTGQLRWLFLGAFIVGLGFNIKMLQAFLPLPAFFACYFFGAKYRWDRKILYLAAATAVLVAVSFSWALAVDLTPASARPYVDSSSNNTVMDLIFNHNGLERLTYSAGQPGNGTEDVGPNSKASMDFGTAGTLRLFTAPLAGEASWLLPFVLGGLLLLGASLWKQPFGEQHFALILWAGWLIPEMLYFTYSTGLIHGYYLVMLGPPLAALTAMSVWACVKTIRERPGTGWRLVSLLVVVTLVFQGVTLWDSAARTIWALVYGALLYGAGLFLAAPGPRRARFVPTALTLMLSAMLVAPAAWSALTTFNVSPDSVLPYAGPVRRFVPGLTLGNARASQPLLNYLLANTQPRTYLFATGRSTSAAPYILATGRPVLPIGGFVGNEEVLTVNQLAELVESGRLRFVLDEDLEPHPGIAGWVKSHCSKVEIAGLLEPATAVPGGTGRQPADPTLHDCKN